MEKGVNPTPKGTGFLRDIISGNVKVEYNKGEASKRREAIHRDSQ